MRKLLICGIVLNVLGCQPPSGEGAKVKNIETNASHLADLVPCSDRNAGLGLVELPTPIQHRASYTFWKMINASGWGGMTLPLFKRYENMDSIVGYVDKVVGVSYVSIREDGGKPYAVIDGFNLCGDLGQSEFIYGDFKDSVKVHSWLGNTAKSINVTQDEGLLKLSVQDTELENHDAEAVQVVKAKYEIYGGEKPIEGDHLMTASGEFYMMIPKALANLNPK
jgi:hypothetical protein